MNGGILANVALGWIFVGSIAGFLLATGVGYRIGTWVAARRSPGSTDDLGTTLGGLLGLLGLLLAFTFGMAGDRYERRVELVVDDANAIGTAWLRTDLVAEPARSRARALLLEYGRERVALVAQIRRSDPSAVLARMDELHRQLWAVASAVGREQPSPTTALFVSAVNDVIDVHGKRVALGARNPVPPVIVATLMLVSLVVLVAMGYGRGLTGDRSAVAPAVLASVLAVVLTLILDLGRPGEGFLRASQQAMTDVVQMMENGSR